MNRREIARASDARLFTRSAEINAAFDANLSDEDRTALQDEHDTIDAELEARDSDRHEPQDYDQQDRNAAAAERYDNFRLER